MIRQIKFLRNKGFTLIEILIAMLLLGIGLLGLAGMTVVVMRSNTLSQQISDATNVASHLMDTVRSQIAAATTLRNCVQRAPCSGGNTVLSKLPNSSWYPQAQNGDDGTGPCGLKGIITSTPSYEATFEVVDSQLNSISGYSQSQDFCALTASGFQLGARQFLRYYRIEIPSSDTTSRIIYVVVLWKDKFGNWQNVHFSTTQ